MTSHADTLVSASLQQNLVVSELLGRSFAGEVSRLKSTPWLMSAQLSWSPDL